MLASDRLGVHIAKLTKSLFDLFFLPELSVHDLLIQILLHHPDFVHVIVFILHLELSHVHGRSERIKLLQSHFLNQFVILLHHLISLLIYCFRNIEVDL